VLFDQPSARMGDTGLEMIVRHYIGLQTQKTQWQALRLTERNAFALIDYLLQFNVVLLNHFAPKRNLINHPLL
jgi:hypothetical protein